MCLVISGHRFGNKWNFLCPPVYTGGHNVFALSVCWFVCWFVCTNFNIGHNFCNIEDSNLIFGLHVYRMELHILSGERSRSSFKVKGQIYGSKSLQRGHSVSQTHHLFLLRLYLSYEAILFYGNVPIFTVTMGEFWRGISLCVHNLDFMVTLAA